MRKSALIGKKIKGKMVVVCLFCALLLVAMPLTALAEEALLWDNIAYTIEGAYDQDISGNSIAVDVRGEYNIFTDKGVSQTATITLTNQSGSEGKLFFDWAEDAENRINRLEINGTEVSKSGHFEEAVGSGKSVIITIITAENAATNTLIMSDIKFTKIEHNYESEVTAPTCTEEGYTTHTCTSCVEEHSYTDNVIAALGHTEVTDEAVEATCTTNGLTEGKHCSVCGEVLEAQQEITAPGHTPADAGIETAPTCEEKGYTTYTCGSCGESYSIIGDNELGHSFSNYVSNNDATCTADGTKTAKCDRCDVTDTVADVDSARGHNYGVAVTPPTCAEKGYTTYTCTRCDHSYVDDETAALGHSYSNYASNNDATCTADGTKTAKCDRCDVTDTIADAGSARGHQFIKYTPQAATCAEKGQKEHWQCSICRLYFAPNAAANAQGGVAENTDYILEASGHQLTSYPGRNPTYTQAGWKPYEACGRSGCGYTTFESIAALGMLTLESYAELIENLARLEEMAENYCESKGTGDPLGLVLGYITGVETDRDFEDFVEESENEYNATVAEDREDYFKVTALKQLPGFFTLPGGQQADLTHLFQVMEAIHRGDADAGGWAGSLLELVKRADDANLNGSEEEIARALEENYFAKAAGYSQTRLFADLDALALMNSLGEYNAGKLSGALQGYFANEVTEKARAEGFLQSRLSGYTTRQQIRQAICQAYDSNPSIAAQKGGYAFAGSAALVAKTEKAACRVFADYLCRKAGIVGEIDLSLSAEVIRARDKISLTVELENGFNELSGYQFTVKYDPKLFAVSKIDTQGTPTELGVVVLVNDQTGEITLRTEGEEGANQELTGPLAVVEFTAKKTARGGASFAVTEAVLNIRQDGAEQTHPADGSWKTAQRVEITPILPTDDDYDGLLTQIVIGGLEAPKKYQTADMDFALSEGPEMGQAVWSPEPDFRGGFAADTAYTLSIPYTMDEYYTLDPNLVVKVEGLEQEQYSAVVENGVIRITFAKTEPKAPTGLELWVLNGQGEGVDGAAVPYAGSTVEYDVTAWVLYDDQSIEQLTQTFACMLTGGEGSELTQSENGWKLILSPAAQAGNITLKAECVLGETALSARKDFALSREANRLTLLEITGEGEVSFTGQKSLQYSVTGRNQYGEVMSAGGAVWRLKQEAEGVSIDPATGLLTVGGRTNQTVVVCVTCGEVTAEKTVELTYRAASTAKPGTDRKEPAQEPVEEPILTPVEQELPTEQVPQAPVEDEVESLPLPEAPAEDADQTQQTQSGPAPQTEQPQPQPEKPRNTGTAVAVAATVAAAGGAAAALHPRVWKKKRRR